MMKNRIACGIALVVVLLVASLSACSTLESLVGIKPGTSAGAVADGVDSYCKAAGPLGRQAVRQELGPKLAEQGAEVCLGCEGDPETICSGAHRPKVDDPGEAS